MDQEEEKFARNPHGLVWAQHSELQLEIAT